MKLLHAQATPTTRLWLTRYVYALWGLHFLFYSVERLSHFPEQYYAPSGLFYWLPESIIPLLFSENGLFAARMLGIAACAACLAPQCFRYASIIVCVLITLEQSHVRGFSWHLNHTEVNLMFAAYLLCLFAWADRPRLSEIAPEKPGFNADAVPLLMIALLLCATYFFVGMTRLVFGGWQVYWDDSIVNATLLYSRQPWYVDFNLASLAHAIDGKCDSCLKNRGLDAHPPKTLCFLTSRIHSCGTQISTSVRKSG